MTRPGIEPRSPGPLANTLPAWPMSQFNIKYHLTINGSLISTTIFFRASLRNILFTYGSDEKKNLKTKIRMRKNRKFEENMYS